jgi:copper chaperone
MRAPSGRGVVTPDLAQQAGVLPHCQRQHDRKESGSKHVILATPKGKTYASQKGRVSQKILTFSAARRRWTEGPAEFRRSVPKIPQWESSTLAPTRRLSLARASMPGVMKSVGLRYSGMNNPQRDDASAVQTTTLSIAGMSCDACVHHVRRALDGVPGVVHVEVNLRHNRATIEHLPRQAIATVLAAAVQDAGYQARIAPSIGDSDSAPSRVGPPAACGCGCCADPRKSVDRSWDLGTSTIG